MPVDFFQEWASARNYHEGLPIYTSQQVTLSRYLSDLGIDPPDNALAVGPSVTYNAHPPVSVLLVLPLGRLSYANAFRIWGLLSLLAVGASLWLIVKGLRLKLSPAGWALALLALAVCFPLRNQFHQGQLSAVLMLLLVGAWAAARSGRDRLAGVALGVATAVKLFPGLLFCHFLLRGRRSVVFVGVSTFLLLTCASVSVFGIQTYADYLKDVMPGLEYWHSSWHNASLLGFFKKLFNPNLDYTEPVLRSPLLALAGWAISGLALVAFSGSVSASSRSQEQEDFAYCVNLIIMQLLSPLTWQHSFLLMILPLLVLWDRLPSRWWARWLFFLSVPTLWLNPGWWVFRFLKRSDTWLPITPLHSVTVASVQFYGLLTLFALGVLAYRFGLTGGAPPHGTCPAGQGVGPGMYLQRTHRHAAQARRTDSPSNQPPAILR
jgi:hypothetical protein